MDPAARNQFIELVSIREVSRRLSVSRSHLYEIVGAGGLTIVKVGAASRIRSDDLDAYVAALPATKIARRERRS